MSSPLLKNSILFLSAILICACSGESREPGATSVSTSHPIVETATRVEPMREVKKEQKVASENAFHLVYFLSGKVELNVPIAFSPMEPLMFSLKYPPEDPTKTVALSDEDATVSLLISPREEIFHSSGLAWCQEIRLPLAS